MAIVSPAENSGGETGSPSIAIHIPLLWVLGVVLSLLMPVVGLSQLFLLARRSRLVDSDDWNCLLQQLRSDLRIRRRVRLLQSSRTKAPLTWGALRPVVLLPAEAVEWPESRRQMVLLHELSHVKRLDWLTQMIGQLASALHWFNPLVWILATIDDLPNQRFGVTAGGEGSDMTENR
jgi:beta-lactamase regulating signal transducer with metallopeptidase domain